MRRFVVLFSCLLLLLLFASLYDATQAEEIKSLERSFQQRFNALASEAYEKQRLVRYGYQIFEQPTTDFEALRHLPVGPNYVLGPGDTLIIRIYGTVFMEHEVEIDRDGRVNVPDVGPIELIGLTFQEARGVLADHVKTIYSGINVNVTMGELRSIFVHVIGEVNRPGIHEISNLSTVIQALFASRGPSRLGSLREIRVYRDHQLITRFDLYDFFLEGRLEKDIRLKDNDVIFVPSISNLVAIGGEVKRPGIFESKADIRLSELINMAGGPTPTAFLANIKIERIQDKKEIVLLEIAVDNLETFAGSEWDIFLEGSDLVFVDFLMTHRMPARQAFVTISGNITRPGDFRVEEGMRVKDLIDEAGGILSETMLHRGEIWRFVSINTRQVIPFVLEKALEEDLEHNLELMEWDLVRIYAEYDILPDKMVGIDGEVHKPGQYRFVEGMTLRDLLFRGHEPTDDAYLNRAELFRYRQDELREVIAVDLNRVLSGEQDIMLEQGDHLQVYGIDWVFPTQKVQIHGAVRNPGSYELFIEMYLSDLIFQAGGLEKEAYLDLVEIYRPHYGSNEGPSLLATSLRGFDEAVYGVEEIEGDILLMPGDRVYVRSHITDMVVRRITLVGEVHLPGEYTLREGERLSSVIERAGGLTEMAYPFGAIMTREDIKGRQRKFLEDFVSYQRQTIAEERARLLELSLTTLEREERSKALDYQEQALELMLARLPEGRILFDLDSAVEDSTSFHNLLLHHKDRLVIPPRPGVVMITGEVFNPESIIYDPRKSLDDYITMVGGVTSRGDREAIYIIKANGQVESISAGYGPLHEGDMIVVPPLNLWKGGH